MNILAGKNVLVTGGAGLVGSHIVDALVRERANVVVYDSFIRGRREHLDWASQHGNVKIIAADLQDKDSLDAALTGVDFVFHQAAAWLRLCQKNPRLSVEVNIVGTFNLLDMCVRHKVRKIVAASSSSVYGEGLYLPTDEGHPYNNNLFYGAAKVANEQHYRCFAKEYGLEFVALRYLNVYGPRQPFDAAYMDVIMNFLNRINADLPPQIRGDGSATTDLVFVEDVAKANLLAMKSDVRNDFFNVAGGRETTLTELANLLILLCGKAASLKPEYISMDQGLVTRRWGCPKKARNILGFEATTPVAEGMKKVIAWRAGLKGAR